MTKQYLGDGVYVEHDSDAGQYILTADGNVIYLEPEVYNALSDFVDRVRAGMMKDALAAPSGGSDGE